MLASVVQLHLSLRPLESTGVAQSLPSMRVVVNKLEFFLGFGSIIFTHRRPTFIEATWFFGKFRKLIGRQEIKDQNDRKCVLFVRCEVLVRTFGPMGPFLHTGDVFVAQFVHSCMTLVVVVAFSSFFEVEIEFVCCCCCAGGENSFRLCFDISPQLSAVSDDTMLSVLSIMKMFFTQLSVLSIVSSASKDKLNFKLCAIFCCLCGFYVSFLLELLGCSNRKLCLLLALQTCFS